MELSSASRRVLQFFAQQRFASFILVCVLAVFCSWQAVGAEGLSPASGVAPNTSVTLGAVGGVASLRDLKTSYNRPHEPPMLGDKALTASRELLGRTLFFDPRLSGSGWISCATCHNPGFRWEDRLPTAIGNGMKQLKRRTPTISNLAWGQRYFWDGRAPSLEAQALNPVVAESEMGGNLDQVVHRIAGREGYRALFEKAYPGSAIDSDTIAKALAGFERTIVSGEAPFDQWVEGDESAISESAKRGFAVFNNQGQCALCHSGWRFTDDSFHDIGVNSDDLGRGAILKIPPARFTFKTPTLRNIAKRGPYMHNGSEATLEAVIDLYVAGGRVKRYSLAAEIQNIQLSPAEKADLLAFLKTLNSDDIAVAVPPLP